MTVSIRTAIRIASFTAAALLLMLGAVIASTVRTNQYRSQMESQYVRSVQEMAGHMNAITGDLQKAAYAGTPAQIGSISSNIWRDAGSAKAALGNLPLSDVSLDTTYRFLSQVGDYAMYLSRKAAQGGEITLEERENLDRLTGYARQFQQQVAHMERVVSSGAVEITGYLEVQLAETETQLAGAAAVMGSLEEDNGVDGYPTLIYDGPFSDNLLDRSAAMTEGLAEIPREQARAIAAEYAGLEPVRLFDGTDELSRMPSYRFRGTHVDVGVTKQGGYVTYLLSGREIGARQMEVEDARRVGREYLEGRGIGNMQESYYELARGVLTINYAHTEKDVTCYTDLIKVGVAMDNGEVVFYDARGYINNHRERLWDAPALAAEQAAQSVSPLLKIDRSRLALIPTGGGGEVLAYEFFCTGRNGETVLVYINCNTGAEEQILILLENENGTLAI